MPRSAREPGASSSSRGRNFTRPSGVCRLAGVRARRSSSAAPGPFRRAPRRSPARARDRGALRGRVRRAAAGAVARRRRASRPTPRRASVRASPGGRRGDAARHRRRDAGRAPRARRRRDDRERSPAQRRRLRRRPARARAAAFVPNDTGLAALGGPPGGWAARSGTSSARSASTRPARGTHADPARRARRPRRRRRGPRHRRRVREPRPLHAARPDLAPARVLRGLRLRRRRPLPQRRERPRHLRRGRRSPAAANNGYGMVGVAYAAKHHAGARARRATARAARPRIAAGHPLRRQPRRAGHQRLDRALEPDRRAAPLSITAAPDIRAALATRSSQGVVVVGASGNPGQRRRPDARLGARHRSTSAGRPSTAASATTRTSGPASTSSPPAAARTPSCRRRRAAARRSRPGATIAQVTLPPSDAGRFLVPGDYEGTSMAAPHVTGVDRADARRQAPSAPTRRPTRSSARLKAHGARPRRRPGATALRLRACSTPTRARSSRRRRARPSVVRMISTQQGAWWLTLFGTEPSRKRLAPGHALVADDDQVGALLLGDVEDRVGRVALARVGLAPRRRRLAPRSAAVARASRRRPRAG